MYVVYEIISPTFSTVTIFSNEIFLTCGVKKLLQILKLQMPYAAFLNAFVVSRDAGSVL